MNGSPESLETILLRLLDKSQTLQARLDSRTNEAESLRLLYAESTKQLQELRLELESWKQSSTEALAQSETLRTALRGTETSLAASQTTLAQLSRSTEAYKATAQKQLADLERSVRTWRTVAMAGILGALAAGLLVGVLIP